MDKNDSTLNKNSSKTKSAIYKSKLVSARSYKNVKNLFLNNLSSVKDSGVNSTIQSSTNKSGMTKFQSAMNLKKKDNSQILLTKSSSLKPFPKLDPEFYDEKKNYFWQKQMTKIRSEKSIFSEKFALRKQLSQKNNKFVYESQIFNSIDKNSKKKINMNTTKNVTVDLSQPLKKSLQEIHRDRMFHSNVNVTNPDNSLNFEHSPKRKTLSPMHLKLYESTMFKNTNKKVTIPKSHPSYNKDPIEKQKLTPSNKKRLEFLKTNYNFTKSYI